MKKTPTKQLPKIFHASQADGSRNAPIVKAKNLPAKRSGERTVPAIPAEETAPITIPLPPAHANPGERIVHWHMLSKVLFAHGVRCALFAGLELLKVKGTLGHGDFGEWVENNCHFSEPTAWRYMTLSKKVFHNNLMELLAEESTSFEQAVHEVITSGEISSTSLSGLYQEYGISKNTNLGGAREGAGRPKQKTLAETAAATWKPLLLGIEAELTEQTFKGLTSYDLRDYAQRVSELAEAMHNYYESCE